MRVEPDANWLETLTPENMRRIVDALYRVHQLNALVTDMDTVLDGILTESRHVADAEGCSLLLCEPAADALFFYRAYGEEGDPDALMGRIRLKFGEGVAGEVAASRESAIVNDAGADSRVFREAEQISQVQTRTLLAVPIVRESELIGVLELVNKRNGEGFSEADQHIMEVFSSVAAGVIQTARLVEENIRAARLAAVGQAVAGLSHYTKNILGGLQGSIELIDEGLESDDTDVLKRGWDVLKRSAERLSNVVEDMLAYSKDRTPTVMRADLKAIVNESVDSFRLLTQRKRPDIRVSTDGLPDLVSIDSRGMHRALLNLMNNAGDAIPDEGGKVEVRAFEESDGALIVEVHDNGPGIDEAEVAKIFDPFYSTKGSAGTGLGLAVTRKIVVEQAGTLSVDCSPLGGAAFHIRIPPETERYRVEP